MRLFVSYARVDKPYCRQIVETLDVHDVWYDQRLHAGQQWWDEILRRLEWCEGIVYLLSPDSVNSEYCQKEFAIAQRLGKHIFPVLIHNRTPLPPSLQHLQYADLSNGLTPEAVKTLLNAIYIAERATQSARPAVPSAAAQRATTVTAVNAAVDAAVPMVDPAVLIDEVATALDCGEFDRAVYLLKQARDAGQLSRFIDISVVMREAEEALERQAYLREAEREYRSIAAMMKHERTRKMGCRAFQAFRESFPDYDPDNLAPLCASSFLPMLEWCDVPAGKVVIVVDEKQTNYHVDAFRIAKYPVTTMQFEAFVNAEDGYACEQWWDVSQGSLAWWRQQTGPMPASFSWDDHPRVNVCWYEAVAFCKWLSHRTGLTITLPTEAQWQRAAQGDDGRDYPWGDQFDPALCNTSESKLRGTTPVARYSGGVSPYGVYDMAGNVWEWCLNTTPQQLEETRRATEELPRAVRGGSYISAADRARANFHYYLNPVYRYKTIGFRVMVKA